MPKIHEHADYKKIDSMCSDEKIQFVYNFSKHNSKGSNIIVEIGTFFGAMTQAIRLGCNDKTKK